MILLGDIHGALRVIPQGIIQYGIKDTALIQVGDYGIGFIDETRDVSNLETINEILAGNNIKMYVIRGNHDDPKFFQGNHIYSHLELLPDYSVRNIEGKNVLFVGGGISIDRMYRMDKVIGKPWAKPSYWKDEVFVLDRAKLESMTGIDVVVTHTAPAFCYPFGVDAPIVNDFAKYDDTLKAELRAERATLTEMYEILNKDNKNKITNWYYGHFHSSHEMTYDSTRFTLLNINEFYGM